MTLMAQHETTRLALLRTKPRSERRTILQRELIKIKLKLMKQEMKGGKK